MSILDFFKKKPSSKNPVLEANIKQLIEQALASQTYSYTAPSLTALPAYIESKSWQKEELLLAIDIICEQVKEVRKNAKKDNYYFTPDYWKIHILFAYMGLLLRRNIPYTENELLSLSIHFKTFHAYKGYQSGLPHKPMTSRIEDYLKVHGLSGPIREALCHLVQPENDYADAQTKAHNQYIAYLLQGSPEIGVDGSDELGKAITWFLNQLASEQDKKNWQILVKHLIDCAGKSVPSQKWLKETDELISHCGKEPVINAFEEWLQLCISVLQNIHAGKRSHEYLSEINHNLLKGLIWSCAPLNEAKLNTLLEEYGLQAFKKLGGVGAISIRTGNACLFAFSVLPFEEGIARLSKFRMKIKYPSVHKQIDKYINEVAAKNGYTPDQLEDLATPTFGIENGELHKNIQSYKASIRVLENMGTELLWSLEGKSQKSIPTVLKTECADDIKFLKKVQKDIEGYLPIIRDRIEKNYLKERVFTLEEWEKNYLNHELVRNIARKLIWTFIEAGTTHIGIWDGTRLSDIKKEKIPLSKDTQVKLWHPIESSAEEVLNWRIYLELKEIRQPFKQAYREIYILTEAERNTHNYSNRFAAHILRQHQFTALCKLRGWRYTIMGNWDSHNTPSLQVPHWNMEVEFFVDSNWNETDTNEAGIFNHIHTDQVRYYKQGVQLNMEDVPAMVFSETMRDVDMFVGVCSIGNDPSWRDGGNMEMDAYWQNYSFSDLSESAKMREAVLKRLIPKLAISSQCSFDGKFLIVKGKIRTYHIHIGSGNILMPPNNQYLCIVPDGSKRDKESVFLPFEGDNMLSIIISKALLLANDTAIKDQSIVSQITQK